MASTNPVHIDTARVRRLKDEVRPVTLQEMREAQPERSIQDTALDFCRTFGWLAHHDRPARTKDGWRTAIQGDRGFPDLVALRGGRCVVIEFKAYDQRGKPLYPDDHQAAWLESWRSVPGVEVFVMRPGQEDELEDLLR